MAAEANPVSKVADENNCDRKGCPCQEKGKCLADLSLEEYCKNIIKGVIMCPCPSDSKVADGLVCARPAFVLPSCRDCGYAHKGDAYKSDVLEKEIQRIHLLVEGSKPLTSEEIKSMIKASLYEAVWITDSKMPTTFKF
ncbi:MAG: hypothetical protein Solumvirus2_20 [Solumvirus sp.]|uniref:Uncharacterized protein n=1 Tax=Solumvirus sp. TaxID=2487773 RepID=A0A3G5AJP3_9VIRU|nr:MAG: hypothetical protein Solumvirus2_20 [Solumvirus sp.]